MTAKPALLILPILAAVAATPAIAARTGACEGAPAGDAVRLSVDATGLRNANGEVAFTLYGSDPKRFLAKHGKLVISRVPAAAPVTHACFWLPPGQYALALYHDENGDHHFNRTLWIPKEGFGFSNDAPTTLGLPSFDKVRFALPASGRTVRVAIRYGR